MTRVALALVLLAATTVGACAQTAPSAASDDSVTVLNLNDTAERVLRQDRLTIQLRADVTGTDPARVQAEINRRMTAALEHARGVPSVRAETQGYWVGQQNQPGKPPSWRGMQALILNSADQGALLDLAGKLQQAGLVMSSMNYSLAPVTARTAEDDLTAEALKRLRERADRIAASLGMTVRNFRTVNVGNANAPQPYVMMRAAAAPAAGAAAPPPVAEPGETTVRVTVNAEIVLARP